MIARERRAAVGVRVHDRRRRLLAGGGHLGQRRHRLQRRRHRVLVVEDRLHGGRRLAHAAQGARARQLAETVVGDHAPEAGLRIVARVERAQVEQHRPPAIGQLAGARGLLGVDQLIAAVLRHRLLRVWGEAGERRHVRVLVDLVPDVDGQRARTQRARRSSSDASSCRPRRRLLLARRLLLRGLGLARRRPRLSRRAWQPARATTRMQQRTNKPIASHQPPGAWGIPNTSRRRG